MKQISIILALLLSICSFAQSEKPGDGFKEYRLPESTMRNEPIGFEAAKSGWGGSIWDKGHYYPGIDVEAVRAENRKNFFTKLAIIIVCIAVTIGIGYGIYTQLKNKKKKNKESSKELLIYYKSTKPRRSDRTESSGSGQENCQPS